MAGLDGDRPQVLAYGDLHPENLGVRRTADGVLFYGFDDFDETHPAPFSWDLRRGATALELAGREAGWSPTQRAAVSQAFLSGYAATLAEIRDQGPPSGPRLAEGNAGGAAGALLAAADARTRKQLVKQYADDGAFEASDRLQPVGKKTRKSLAKALGAYRKTLTEAPRDADFHELKDAASRLGSGTGSVGLERLWVLIEGKSGKDKDDVILELKERRPSVLARHVPAPAHRLAAREARTEASVRALWSAGDRFAGTVTWDGRSFAVRERLPQHDRLAFGQLAPADAEIHAREIGALLADLHTGQPLSGPRTAAAARKLAGTLLDSIGTSPLGALSEWAREAADRVEGDQAAFAARLAAGAVLPAA